MMQTDKVCDYCDHERCASCCFYDEFYGIEVEPVRHGKWIPVIWREPTEEEKEHEYGEVPIVMADFLTPNDGDEILITIGGRVMTTVYDGSDGYIGDEDWNDWFEDVTAWMPLPKPYKEDGAE